MKVKKLSKQNKKEYTKYVLCSSLLLHHHLYHHHFCTIFILFYSFMILLLFESAAHTHKHTHTPIKCLHQIKFSEIKFDVVIFFLLAWTVQLLSVSRVYQYFYSRFRRSFMKHASLGNINPLFYAQICKTLENIEQERILLENV